MLKKIMTLVVLALFLGSIFGGVSVLAQDGQEDVIEVVIPITYLQLLNTDYEVFSPYLSEQEGHVALEELEDGGILWTITKELQDDLTETMLGAIEGIPQMVEFDWLVSIEMSDDSTFDVYMDPSFDDFEQINQTEISDVLFFLKSYGYSLWVYEGIGYDDVDFVVNYFNSETTSLVYTENYSVLDLIAEDNYLEITYAEDDLARMNLTQAELIAEIEQMDGHISYALNEYGDVVQKVEAGVPTSLFVSLLNDIDARLISDENLSSFVDFQISDDSYQYYVTVDTATFDEAQEAEYTALLSDFAETVWLYFNKTYENNYVILYFMDSSNGNLVKGVLIPQKDLATVGETVEVVFPYELVSYLDQELVDFVELMLEDGYVAISQNKDGDIVTLMTKEYFDQQIDSLHELIGLFTANPLFEETASILKIEENEDFSEIDVFVDAATFDEAAEEIVTTQIGNTIGTYWVLTGQLDDAGFVLHFIDNDTGEVIKSVEH